MTEESNKQISTFREVVARSVRGAGRVIGDPKKALRDVSDAIAVGIEDKWSAGLIKLVKKLTDEEQLDPNWPDTQRGRFFFQKMESELHGLRTDERMMEAKVSLFLGVVSNKFKDRSDAEAREAWRTVSQLGVADITLLGTIYRLSASDDTPAHELTGIGGWRKLMAQESGLNYEQPVERAENNLVSQGLIFDANNPIHNLANKTRITAWGQCVAGYLREGERLLDASRNFAGLD